MISKTELFKDDKHAQNSKFKSKVHQRQTRNEIALKTQMIEFSKRLIPKTEKPEIARKAPLQ